MPIRCLALIFLFRFVPAALGDETLTAEAIVLRAKETAPMPGEMTYSERHELVPRLGNAEMTVTTELGRTHEAARLSRTTITIMRGSQRLRSSVILETSAGKCRLLENTRIALFYPEKSRLATPVELSDYVVNSNLESTDVNVPGTDVGGCYKVVQDLDSERIEAAMRKLTLDDQPPSVPARVSYFIRHGDFAKLAEIVTDKNGSVLSRSRYHVKRVHLPLDENLFQIPKGYQVIFPRDAGEFSQRLTENELAKPKRKTKNEK